MDYDILALKNTGFYTEIRYNGILLVPVKTTTVDKCELCHFYGKPDACTLISCSGVIYKQVKK
jgi:hypothetical protein